MSIAVGLLLYVKLDEVFALELDWDTTVVGDFKACQGQRVTYTVSLPPAQLDLDVKLKELEKNSKVCQYF